MVLLFAVVRREEGGGKV